MVDTQKPVIKGVEEGEGKTYPEGTLFQVEDANLDKVLVNEQVATPENGNYKVVADGTSCVIRAIDKARHETVYSINVSGTGTPEPPEPSEPEKPEPDDSNVISKSGEYTLKAGVKYHLAEGKWRPAASSSLRAAAELLSARVAVQVVLPVLIYMVLESSLSVVLSAGVRAGRFKPCTQVFTVAWLALPLNR